MLTYKQKNILSFLVAIVTLIIIGIGTQSFVPFAGIGLATIIPLASLQHDQENCNMAGIATMVYVARVDDISTFPLLATNKTLPEHTVDLLGDFVLNPGAFFHTFYSTQGIGELKSEVAGNRDAEYFNITGTFFYPNTNKRALGLANLFKNADVIIIVKEFSGTGSGQMRVIGTRDLPAKIKPSENSGKAFSDQKGITFNFEAASCSVAYVYSGTILTEAGSVQTPLTLGVTPTAIDGSLNSRFIFDNTQAANATITTYTNCLSGNSYRIENTSTTKTITLTLAFGGTITLAASQYADIYMFQDNLPIISNTNQ